MKNDLNSLIEILRLSVQKYGENTPLTLGHLLNICEMARKVGERIEAIEQLNHNKLMKEISPLGQ